MAFWSGKSVWITGASSGIGAALAERIGAEGARVGLVARNEERLIEVAEQVGRHSRCAWAAADVRDRSQLHAAMDRLVDQIGSCDILIASAGVYLQTDVRRFSADSVHQVMETNLGGVAAAIEHVLPGMIERNRGQIVAIASLAARIGLPQAAAYCASKAALVRFMEALRVDLRSHGVATTTILPGTVDTPMITDEERSHAVSLPRATRIIMRAIARRRAECEFPRSTAWSIRAVRSLPTRLFDAIVRRLPAMEEVGEPDRHRPS